MKKILLVLLLGMFLISLASATNISILYGKNTSSGEIVPIEVNDDGSLKTTLDLTESTSLVPKLDNTYNIGTAVLRWATGYFFNFNIDNNLTVVGNVTADYYFGNGSQLTDIVGVASPGGTEGAIQFYDGGDLGGNVSQFFINKTSGYVGIGTTSPADVLTVVGTLNATDIQLASNCADGKVLKWSGGVGTCGDDTVGSGYWNRSGTYVYLANTGDRVGINTTTPQNKLNVVGDINFTGLIYGNGSQLTGIEGLGAETDPLWTGNQSLYYLKSNPFGFWNSTFALFNKTYADTLYYGLSNPYGYYNSTNPQTETDPLWTANQSSYWDTSTDLDTVISADEIAEGKIAFSTACATGNHYYLNGNDLDCEADAVNDAIYSGATFTSVCSGCVGADEISGTACSSVCTDDTGTDDQTCAEVSGCVVGAITDGNTGWGNDYNLLDKDTDPYCSSASCNDAVYSEGTIQSVCTDCIGDSQLLYNTGQHLTTSSNVQFGELQADAYLFLSALYSATDSVFGYNAIGHSSDGSKLLPVSGGSSVHPQAIIAGPGEGIRFVTLASNPAAAFSIATYERMRIAPSGLVTIKTGNLDMDNHNIVDVSKITVGTIDPVYDINGEKYATYMAGMVGIKEEVTGTIMLKSDYTIEFDKLEKGSDLWLFYQTTDFGPEMENLQIFLTPSFDGRVWYEKNPEKNTLTIHGTQTGEVSYRMTANRFDWSKWSNLYLEDNNVTGLIAPLK